MRIFLLAIAVGLSASSNAMENDDNRPFIMLDEEQNQFPPVVPIANRLEKLLTSGARQRRLHNENSIRARENLKSQSIKDTLTEEGINLEHAGSIRYQVNFERLTEQLTQKRRITNSQSRSLLVLCNATFEDKHPLKYFFLGKFCDIAEQRPDLAYAYYKKAYNKHNGIPTAENLAVEELLKKWPSPFQLKINGPSQETDYQSDQLRKWAKKGNERAAQAIRRLR